MRSGNREYKNIIAEESFEDEVSDLIEGFRNGYYTPKLFADEIHALVARGEKKGQKEAAQKFLQSLYDALRAADPDGHLVLRPESVLDLARNFGVELRT